jgi:hypothetical protein
LFKVRRNSYCNILLRPVERRQLRPRSIARVWRISACHIRMAAIATYLNSSERISETIFAIFVSVKVPK